MVEDGDYCAGWVYHRTPARLGLISPNRDLETPTLGKESGSLGVYSHQGDVPGYTCNLYLVPGSDSAVVVLSNGTGWSDATDWIAQDIIQTLHALQPSIDFLELSRQASDMYASGYEKGYKVPLRENRVTGTPLPRLNELVGSYVLPNYESISLDIAQNTENPSRLRATVNKQADQVWELWHYNYDVFCYLPETFDDCLRRGFPPTSWEESLVSFRRNSERVPDSLSLKLRGVDVVLKRT
jgi:hypothetical protein